MPSVVLTLNCCLLPSHSRWIFRAHRGVESLTTAAARVAAAIAQADRESRIDVVHLQEVFTLASLRLIAELLRPVGFVHVTDFERCGLATLSRRRLTLLARRESTYGIFTPKGWAALLVEGPTGQAPEVHINCHFASELDGSHGSRLRQAEAVGDWVRYARAWPSQAQGSPQGPPRLSEALLSGLPLSSQVSQLLVLGDLNEPEGPGAVRLARALGATPYEGETLDDTYRWLGGLVRGRLDRCFRFSGPFGPSAGRLLRDGDSSTKPGLEVAGRVLRSLDDVSDHFPLVVE